MLSMKQSTASAPGKVILFGEHVVVHGRTALAVSVSDLRVFSRVIPTVENSLHFCFRVATKESNEFVESTFFFFLITLFDEFSSPEVSAELSKFCHSKPTLPSQSVLDAIRRACSRGTSTVTDSSQNSPNMFDDKRVVIVLTLLVWGILGDKLKTGGIKLCVWSSGLPIGAGLGSSAAFSVATVAALLNMLKPFEGCVKVQHQLSQHRLNEGKSVTLPAKFGPFAVGVGHIPSRQDLDKINSFSYIAETVFHGTPSGIDNTVSTYGGAVAFRKTSSVDNPSISSHELQFIDLVDSPLSRIQLLITNTNVIRSTRDLVLKVKQQLELQPFVTSAIFDAVEAVVQRCLKLLETSVAVESKTKTAAFEFELSRLIDVNHCLLSALQVSHPKLEFVRQTTKEYGGLSTKLTGAGGGGSAISLLPMEKTLASIEEQLEAMKEILHKGGCTCI
eukprot:g5120.t1